MIVLGLTGSIGMGKSTTSQFFRDAGVPVHDADQVVHDLYAGPAVSAIGEAFPGVVQDSVVDRVALSKHVLGEDNLAAMKKLEAIVHPMVRALEDEFRKESINGGFKLAVLDIPLLFETGRETLCDGIVVVTAPASVQRERVLARETMTQEKFDAILARQTPDAVKREKADFIIDTSLGMEAAKTAVNDIIQDIESGRWKPAD